MWVFSSLPFFVEGGRDPLLGPNFEVCQPTVSARCVSSHTHSRWHSRRQAWETWSQLYQQCHEGRVEPTSVLGEGHRDRKVQDLTATSPSGLQRLCDRGMTGTAHSSDTGETQLRTEVQAVMCELQWKSMKAIVWNRGYHCQDNVWLWWLWPKWLTCCLGVYPRTGVVSECVQKRTGLWVGHRHRWVCK